MSDLHSSQRENTVEFVLARLDWGGVHESIVELEKQRKKKQNLLYLFKKCKKSKFISLHFILIFKSLLIKGKNYIKLLRHNEKINKYK